MSVYGITNTVAYPWLSPVISPWSSTPYGYASLNPLQWPMWAAPSPLAAPSSSAATSLLDPWSLNSTVLQATLFTQMGRIYSANLPQVVQGLAANAQGLSDAANALLPLSGRSVWDQRLATVSDASKASASAANGATITSYTLSIQQLARAQQNQGTALASAAASTVAPGTNTFNLTVNGTSTAISFVVNAGDTNLTVLSNMAAAINKANTGVTATVQNNTINGTSTLVLTGQTGARNAFSLADVTGNAVAQTGITNVVLTSQDAIYTLNGNTAASPGNTLVLDAGKLTVTLMQPTTSAVSITVGNNTDAIQQAIAGFVSQYNALVSFLQQNAPFINPDVLGGLTSRTNSAIGATASFGISANPNGMLTLNSGVLSSALAQNPRAVQDAVGGYNGLAALVGGYANALATMPASNLLAGMPPAGLAPVPASYASTSIQAMLVSQLFGRGTFLNTWV